MTRETERELIRAWQEDADMDALNALVRAHWKQIWLMAQKYRNRWESAEDLAGAGFLRFVQIVNLFDHGYTGRLSTLVRWWVGRHMRTRSVRALGRGLSGSIFGNDTRYLAKTRAAAARDALFGERWDDVHPYPVHHSLEALTGVQSHEPRWLGGHDGGFDGVDADHDAVAVLEVARLTVKERRVMRGRVRGEKMKDIAAELGVTRQRVQQIDAEALVKVRRAARREP